MSSMYILHHMVESYRYYKRGMEFRGEGSTSRNKVLKFCEGHGGVYAKPFFFFLLLMAVLGTLSLER